MQNLVDEEFQGIVHLRTSSLHKKISSARHDFLKLSGSENKLDALLQVYVVCNLQHYTSQPMIVLRCDVARVTPSLSGDCLILGLNFESCSSCFAFKTRKKSILCWE